MARVAALIPDLLFGSKVRGVLAQGGHDVALVPSQTATLEDVAGVDVVVVDLASPEVDGVALLERLRAAGALDGVRTLATYSHIDADMRRRGLEAGFDAVVPRSRLMREGAAVLSELTAA